MTHPLKRLFGYAAPYRGRLAAAVAGMLVYAAGSAGLAALVRPDSRQRARQSGSPRVHRMGARGRVPLEGHRLVRVVVLDGRCRAARRHRSAERAVSPHPRAVRRLLRPADHRAADVAHHQRRRPGAAGGVRDRRRPHARVARARRIRGADVLPGRAARHRLHDGGAAPRLPAHPARAASAAHDQAQPGGARAALAHQRRGVLGTPHRQGVRDGGARIGKVRPGRLSAVQNEHESDRGALQPAAADGAARRVRDGGGAVVRRAADCERPSHDRSRLPRSSPPPS